MKKVLVIALMLGAGLAYASTLGVPWFADNAATGSNPPAANGDIAQIYLHSNSDTTLEVTIEYFTSTGNPIGPEAPFNTFFIEPNSSLAFRPVPTDPASESAAAQLIPNRPPTAGVPVGNDGKKNGSIVLSWTGPDYLLQGSYRITQCRTHDTSSTNTTPIYMLAGYGHLLPPGVTE